MSRVLLTNISILESKNRRITELETELTSLRRQVAEAVDSLELAQGMEPGQFFTIMDIIDDAIADLRDSQTANEPETDTESAQDRTVTENERDTGGDDSRAGNENGGEG